ncbi:chromatin protein Cren7 [Thermosphaera chiliense]|uniref:Chromatin protein Cren7 n=1 Tax=Thermosphaera chiliense TaxID=3402707 RepID=A0A7M1UQ09_9CREN|nr:chromatin protein Cren7 [Thermosphaera aggregans]QOR94291.1 chromatin protein Cren7 [Thermosphaera aggregans]
MLNSPKKESSLKCPRCGSNNIEVIKSWQLVAPIPDAQGRITVTMMGVVKCGSCGYKWKTTISKLKVGGKSVEIEGGSSKKVLESESEEREVKEIVLDISDILNEKD